MEVTEKNLRERYESLETEELIELYTKTELTDLASSVLTQILGERGVPLEKLPKLSEKRAKESEAYQEDASPSFLQVIDYIKHYESVETRKLVELYRKGELNELAASALTQVLEERGISPENLSKPLCKRS
jgi:hypothetical protein